MQRTLYKKYSQFGPGGMHCPCCGPAPGNTRRKALRVVKKRERRKSGRETEQQSRDTSQE